MIYSKPVKKPRGKAFAKGNDARRNMAGNLNAELQSYEIRFHNALAQKLSPDEFAQIVADDVRHRRPGAREFAGKALRVAQERMEFSTAPDMKMTLEVVHVDE
jgi:hypothetical protein